MEPVRAAHRAHRRAPDGGRARGRRPPGVRRGRPAHRGHLHQPGQPGRRHREARRFTSPASRAADTARLAGLPSPQPDPDLQEWDYGGYEGLTSAEIGRRQMGWYLWRDGVIPGDAEHPGETEAEVGGRADAVLRRVSPLLERGDVALVAHGHLLRVLAARWLGLAPAAGRYFGLDTGTLSLLGFEHDEPVIRMWNVTPDGTG
jgi:broad specificity phosphatase PhoE